MDGGYEYCQKNKLIYKWEIINISNQWAPRHDTNTILESSLFSTGSHSEDQWKLEVYLNNGPVPVYSADYLTVFLINMTNADITVDYSVYFVSREKKKFQFIDSKDVVIESKAMDGTHFLKSDLVAETSELMPLNTLTVCVEVIVSNKKKVMIDFVAQSTLLENFNKVYGDESHSDVTIIIEGKPFRAHKALVATSSTVLAAMLTDNIGEKSLSEIVITDITPQVFEKILCYIYTNTVQDLDSVAVELLKAADKFKLQSLKTICEVALCKTLSYNNVIDMIRLAEDHKTKTLLEYVIKCIEVDAQNIIKSKGFKDLDKSSTTYALVEPFLAINNNNAKEITYSSPLGN